MTFRSILATALAGLVLSTSLVATADAATRRRPMTARMTHARRGAMPMAMRRGGDTQNADVDRLNAQSLANARGGAAPTAQ